MHRWTAAAVATGALLIATPAMACGGLFCNLAQPINQAAERILFAVDGDVIHMHVQIAYSGPPAEFGWILPVPPDVVPGLSNDELFRQLDLQYAPRFTLQTEFADGCQQPPRAASDSSNAGGGGDGVAVLSRQAIGPYETAVLEADSIEALRGWLDENEYQIPDSTDAALEPYIELGAAFVTLKMLPGTDEGDIQPIWLAFGAQVPSIPIRPTAVAAEPDMGVIVHVLGEARAVPRNYRHVQINLATIDWPNGGQNYPDVVGQAVDEAGGRAFVTDYAGSAEGLELPLVTVPDATLRALEFATRLEDVVDLYPSGLVDADLIRVFGDGLEFPEGVTPEQFFGCPQCFEINPDAAVDGGGMAARIRAEINPARAHLQAVLADKPVLTRLYTTLSANEMTEDPVFSFNADLDEVPALRTATVHIACADDGRPMAGAARVVAGDIEFQLDNGEVPDAIARDRGETVRGMYVPAARIIENLGESGAPEVVEDRTEVLRERYGAAGDTDVGGGGGDGCDCDVGRASGGSAAWFGLLLLVGLVRRRR